MSDQPQALWQAAQQTLRGMLKTELYNLWFAPVTARCLDGDILTLEVADEFCEFWLKDNYLDVLRSVISRAAIRPIEVQFAIRVADPAAASAASADAPADRMAVAPEPVPVARIRPADRAGDGRSGETQRKPEGIFNPNNTFETFVVGANNHHAHAACMGVAQKPGHTYNPLFLFGGVGLGKTHLLQAIGHHVMAHKKNARIGYLSCERFTNEFIEALQNSQITKFRKKHRELDVLLIDDIQFMGGKEGTQDEFFHTFNFLHNSGRQIVITSDRPPKSIPTLEERLRSRFEWGLITDIQPPDVETREAILRRKAERERVKVNDDVLRFIATNVKDNIRELEGALNRVCAYAFLNRVDIDVPTTERVLHDLLSSGEPRPITSKVILEATARMFGFAVDDLIGQSRRRPLVTARQTAMYAFRELTDFSYPMIGREFGGRDHTTVIHAVEKISEQMKERRAVYEQVTELIRFIRSGG